MIRWSLVALLCLCAVGTAWWAQSRLSPRGVMLKIYDNPDWAGTPTHERRVKHVEFGPRLRHNRMQLPENSSLYMDGWLYAPRTGPYAFEVESGSKVWLAVAGETVLKHRRGRPGTRGNVHLRRGYHPFHLQMSHKKGESFLNLKWQLPSGYMDMETLPPIFLEPDAPKVAPVVPAALRIGPFLWLLLALFVAMWPRILRWFRALIDDKTFRLRVVTGVLIVSAAISYRNWDLDAAGETSDEWAYSVAGRIYVSNIVHGYFQSRYWHSNEEHPPIGKYIYGLVTHLSGDESYTPLRRASAVMSGLIVLITFLFALRFFNLWTGITAGLVLTFLPHFVAHGKVAALDCPAALFFTWAVYLSVCAITAKDRLNIRFFWAGLVASFAFAVKFSNVLVLVFLFVAHFISQWHNVRKHGWVQAPLVLYVIPILPLILLLIVWPWLWKSPFGQLVATLQHWDYPIQEWFLGDYRQPPWYYFPVSFIATTPSLLLIPVGAFIVRVFRRKWFIDLLVLIWFLTPFLWTVSALKQDGIRYIYTMFPALALMIGVGATVLAKTIRWRAVTTTIISMYLAIQSWYAHPYYLNFYSELVGGTATVYKASWFEVGWWGEGMDKAYNYINEVAPFGASYDVNAVVTHTTDMLREDIRYDPRRPDFFVKAYLTPGEEEREGYEELMRVQTYGAPLVIVYERLKTSGRKMSK